MRYDRRVGARVIAIGVLLLVGCGESIYACHGDASCKDGDRTGRCEPNGACSFPDPECPSGYRFGAHASNGLAGECVPDDPIAGTATGSTSTTVSSSTTSTTRDVTSEGEAEATTFDKTTSSDGESTAATTMPITDTAADSSSGAPATTGPSPGDPYGSCERAECIAGSQCEPIGSLPLTCAPECDSDAECPAPLAGEAIPTCVGMGSDKWCVLACTNGTQCPDGMDCESYEPRYGELCTWF